MTWGDVETQRHTMGIFPFANIFQALTIVYSVLCRAILNPDRVTNTHGQVFIGNKDLWSRNRRS